MLLGGKWVSERDVGGGGGGRINDSIVAGMFFARRKGSGWSSMLDIPLNIMHHISP